MIRTTHKEPDPDIKLIEFLKKDFALSEEAVNLGIKQSKLEGAPVSVILKHLGLITIDQYQILIDWLDSNLLNR